MQGCCWRLWALRWQSVWYLLSTPYIQSNYASLCPARLQPAACSSLLHFQLMSSGNTCTLALGWLIKGYSNTFHVGDNMTPLAAFYPTFFHRICDVQIPGADLVILEPQANSLSCFTFHPCERRGIISTMYLIVLCLSR